MQRLFVLLLACGGCDQIFGLTRSDDAGVDASRDGAIDQSTTDAATLHPCAGRTPTPLFCFDFDGPTLVGYAGMTEFPVAPLGVGVQVERRAPATTGPNGLWFTGVMAGAGFIDKDEVAVATGHLDASFSLHAFSPSTSTNNPELFHLALDRSGSPSCGLSLNLQNSNGELVWTLACGGSTGTASLGFVTTGWTRFEVSFDGQSGLTSIKRDNAMQAQLQAPADAGRVTSPRLRFGLGFSEPGVSIGFDDIEVRAQ